MKKILKRIGRAAKGALFTKAPGAAALAKAISRKGRRGGLKGIIGRAVKETATEGLKPSMPAGAGREMSRFAKKIGGALRGRTRAVKKPTPVGRSLFKGNISLTPGLGSPGLGGKKPIPFKKDDEKDEKMNAKPFESGGAVKASSKGRGMGAATQGGGAVGGAAKKKGYAMGGMAMKKGYAAGGPAMKKGYAMGGAAMKKGYASGGSVRGK